MKNQVRLSIAVLAVAVIGAAIWIGTSNVIAGVVVGVIGLAATAAFGWWSLRTGPHTSWDDANARIAPGHAVVLWKPGCRYCERLIKAIGPDERVTWVNVWQDDEAQAQVCRLNEGNEYTPTAIVGEHVLRNPSADELRAALA